MGAGWMNLGSLALGLTAWALPAAAVGAALRGKEGHWTLFLAASGLACAGALCLQLAYSAHLAQMGDAVAWMETAEVSAWLSQVLLIVTAVLNALAALAVRVCRGAGPDRRT